MPLEIWLLLPSIVEIAGKLGPAVITAFTALATLCLSNWFAKAREDAQRREREKERAHDRGIEFRRTTAVQPILEYVELNLRFLDDVYYSAIDNKGAPDVAVLMELRTKEGMVRARAAYLGDGDLVAELAEFAVQVFRARRAIAEGNAAGDGFDEKKKAIDIATSIVTRLAKAAQAHEGISSSLTDGSKAQLVKVTSGDKQ